MSEGYTPTTENVEDGYAHDPESEYRDPINYGSTVQANRRAFRRWLAAHDAEVRRGSLPPGAKWFPVEGGIQWRGKLYYPADYVMTRTDIAALTAQVQAAQQNLSAVLTRGPEWLRARADSIERTEAE